MGNDEQQEIVYKPVKSRNIIMERLTNKINTMKV